MQKNMTEKKRKRNTETAKRAVRVNNLVRVVCLMILLVMTRLCVAADALPGSEAEKNVIRIILRPEKTEGEPDPDLSDEIRMQVREQTGREDPELEDRLCACITWSYEYEGELMPPGEKRLPGESDIVLFFEEDPEYVFEGWTASRTLTDQDADSTESEEMWGTEEEIPEEYEDEWEYEEETPPVYEEIWDQEQETPAEYTEKWASEEEMTDEYEDMWDSEEGIAGEYEEMWDAEEEMANENEEMWDAEEMTEGSEESGEPGTDSGEAELRSFLTTWPREEDEPGREEDESGREENEPELAEAENKDNSGGEDNSGEEPAPDTENLAEEEFYDVNTDEQDLVDGSAGKMQEEVPESVRPEGGSMGRDTVNSPGIGTGSRYVPQAVSDSPDIPQAVTENIEDLIRSGEESAKAAEGGAAAEIRLLHTDSSGREKDLTEIYREALAGTDPEKINWETVLAPLPENDGTYVLRRTETDNSGKSTVRDTAFSVNRFGSVYTYSETAQDLRGKIVRSVSAPLVVSEFNPDTLEPDSWNIALSLDGNPVEPVRYTVCKSENRKNPEKWNRYDYVIAAENFREDGVYRLKISSRDTSGNSPETHRYNGGELVFTVDGTPPDLQAVQGLEKAVVTGRKAEIKVTAFDTIGLARVSAFVDGKCMAAEDTFSDRHRAELSFSIARGASQNVRIVAEDTAGNVLDTDEKTSGNQYRFRPSFPFVRQITVRMPVSDVPRSRRSPALLLMIIGCAGASGGLLWYAYRRREQVYRRPERDSDPD